ncbi:MAG: virB8 [Gammaproteobacteria bacterium]|jgi:type IV secretion system protein VirB8|nr:virB8 [Gammaproteobacteria bacterium]
MKKTKAIPQTIKIMKQRVKAAWQKRLTLQPCPGGTEYYSAAKNWYEEAYESLVCSRDRYRLLACFLGGLLTLSLLTVILLFPLKHDVYRILTINQTTGEVAQLKELDTTHWSESWVMTRYFINQYIQNKETYHYEDIKRSFNVALAMSAPSIAKAVQAQIIDTNPLSPINVLGKEGSQEVNVLSINQLNAHTALARFHVVTHPKEDTAAVKQADFQVVLKWDYQNTKATLQERDLNPLGFRVTYYQASPVFAENGG